MKILVIQDFLRSGGTERQSILLANAFAAGGHATTLLTFRPRGRLVSTVSSTVSLRALQPFDFGLDWFAPGLRSAVRQVDPEVILCMGRMANCYGARLQREFRDAAVVATMRTGRNLPAMFVRSLRIVRRIIANSHDARETLIRQHAISAEKISVIYNALVFPGASHAPNATTRESVRSRHGASSTTLVLLCVAMFRPEKAQRKLVETLAELPLALDWQLWLAGDGPARAACEQLVARKQLGSRMKFIGFVRDPSEYYIAADAAVHASASEGLSNFIIEAQAHGLPAVVFQAQGMEECFIPNQTGWALARDQPDAFRAAIFRLAGDSATVRAERAAVARSFARETFDPRRQVVAHLDLFARL
jgi:glycosyltransferase involved in cell wall biosynthesis